MKKIFTPLKETRCCADCKHRIKKDFGIYDECGIYKRTPESDRLLVLKKQRVWQSECPLRTGNLNIRGMFYFKKRIPL